jgi:hypothetical protein
MKSKKNKRRISLDIRIVRSSESIWRVIEKEVVILTPESSTLHVLNELGTRIWEIIDRPIQVEELISKIVSEYEVDEKTAKEDILDFLFSLAEIGALKIEEGERSVC